MIFFSHGGATNPHPFVARSLSRSLSPLGEASKLPRQIQSAQLCTIPSPFFHCSVSGYISGGRCDHHPCTIIITTSFDVSLTFYRPYYIGPFMCGTNAKVGKSSTCLGLLGSLLRQPGLRSSDLAYIKPATQCEKPQLVTEWCEANGVACRGIGPVVFYKVRERGGALVLGLQSPS